MAMVVLSAPRATEMALHNLESEADRSFNNACHEINVGETIAPAANRCYRLNFGEHLD